jgi:hypothetical protein
MNVDLVTGIDGGHPVVVALADEFLSTLLGRLRAVGGFATLFVEDGSAIRVVSVIDARSAIREPQEKVSVPLDTSATVGMFLDYVEMHPDGVALSVLGSALAKDARRVEVAG